MWRCSSFDVIGGDFEQMWKRDGPHARWKAYKGNAMVKKRKVWRLARFDREVQNALQIKDSNPAPVAYGTPSSTANGPALLPDLWKGNVVVKVSIALDKYKNGDEFDFPKDPLIAAGPKVRCHRTHMCNMWTCTVCACSDELMRL